MVRRVALAVTLANIVGFAAGIPLRDDMGNMSMAISTSVPDTQRYFNQGLRFTATFKFDYAVESHQAALDLDGGCVMCEWGQAIAYSQNINDATVMELEPRFLAKEPLAYQAVTRAQKLLADEGGSGGSEDGPMKARDVALVSALARKLVATVDEYKSHFVGGLPASLNHAYAEAMAEAAVRSSDEGWPDHCMVLVVAGDAWMNLSPWDYWEDPHRMRPNAQKSRKLLEDALSLDPNNPWGIHLYTHLMEAGAEAAAAVGPAQKLEHLVPGAPHLQHMQSHVEFHTGMWHEASEANLRAVALPDSDASYPQHNLDMLMWSLGVEGRQTESKAAGQRLTAHEMPKLLAGVRKPMAPPERFLAQKVLHLAALADWESVLALDAPPKTADFPVAAHHFARSLAFVDAKDWGSHRREQSSITASVEIMKTKTDYYGLFNALALTRILDLLSRAEALRGGISSSAVDDSSVGGTAENGHIRRNLLDSQALCAESGANGRAQRHRNGHDHSLLERTAGATSANSTGGAGPEELDLLRQAVVMYDALGYDEPPPLPLPPRLYLGAALLRDGSMAGAAEAESVFRELETGYPGMGRTLLGLWRVCSDLDKPDEAREYRQRFLDSWQYSEIWLKDSAHVGGQMSAGDGRYDDGDGRGDTSPATSVPEAEEGSVSGRQADGATVATAFFAVAVISLAVVGARIAIRKRWGWRSLGGMKKANLEYQPVSEADTLVGENVETGGAFGGGASRADNV